MTRRPKQEQGEEGAAVDRQRLTAILPADLIEKARDVCYWTPGLTIAALVEDALRAELKKREAKHGAPFRPRSGPIRTGRPIKR